METDSETKFLSGLIELQYGQDVSDKLVEFSKSVSWAKGWPSCKESFWNAEAFMWSRKISKGRRAVIEKELSFLSNGRNLDLGCGAYSYVKSVGFDLSSKMLDFNEKCVEKVKGDLEGELPFSSNVFDSVTAVFVLNYVQNYNLLLNEVKRALRDGGCFIFVLFNGNVNDWQRQKEVNNFSSEEWVKIVNGVGFLVEVKEKEGLLFFKCGI